MPFFNGHVRENMERQNWQRFKEQIEGLEIALDAPIRVIDNRAEGRDRHGHTRWQGDARVLTHYKDGTQEGDFVTKGVTIFVRAFNNNSDDMGDNEAHWAYATVNLPEMVTQGIGRYAPEDEGGREPLPETREFEYLGYDTGLEIEGRTPITLSGHDVGEIWDDGRCVFINNIVGNVWGFGLVDWDKWLIEPLKQATDPELLAAAREAAKEQAREAFAEMLQDRGDDAITEARTKAMTFATEAGDLEEKLVTARGNREAYARQLNFLLEQEGDLTEELVNQEWAGITNNVNVDSFAAGRSIIEGRFGNRESHWLKVYTKDLFITNPENSRKMALGRFEVTMNFGENTLRIKNLTMPQHGGTGFDAARARAGVGQWDHPHVLNGGLCEAEYRTAITTLLRDRKLAAMTGMLFNILSTVTLNDNWGQHNVRLWEEADTRLREQKGWPEWTADETEHPMVAALNEEAE